MGKSTGKVREDSDSLKKQASKLVKSISPEWQGDEVSLIRASAVLRNPKYINDFQQALLVFSLLVKDYEGVPVTKAVAVTDKQTLKDLIEALKAAKVGAIDVETWSEHEQGGLAWFDPSFRLATINFSTIMGKGWVLPLWHDESPWRNPQQVLDVLKPYILSVKWYMQNGKFDEKCLAQFGIRIHQVMDTMGAVYALDENNRKDLGWLSTFYLGAPEYKDSVDKKAINKAPLENLVEYGARDSDYTLRLAPILKRELKSDPLSKRLFDKLLMPVVHVLTDVELTGLPVHRQKFKAREEVCQGNTNSAIDRLNEFVPNHLRPFNPNSPAQLGILLYRYLDFPIIQTTPAGKPSTAEPVLLRLRHLDEDGIMDLIMEYRKWKGYESRYFNNWRLRMDGRGRLHPNFKPFHTVTGRLSASDPNVQQIPRDTFIRGIIGGRRGWKIVEVDYSQMELRVAAHYSQDKTMLRAFNTGRDIHMETAMAVTGKTEAEITPDERKKAKAVNFGFLYGMGYRKFMDYAKEKYDVEVSEAEAKAVQKLYFDTFRGLRPWHERQRKVAERRKYVQSSLGRKRHLWDIDSPNKHIQAEAERQAINSPVQSMASDMMLFSMVLLHKQLDPNVARMISTVHDSILFEIREEAVDDILPGVIETMENLPLEETFGSLLTVPIVVEAKVGDFWSEGASVYLS